VRALRRAWRTLTGAPGPRNCRDHPRSSKYKHRHTMKFLVGITPSGSISFVSYGYPGSIEDDDIVRESGLIDLIEQGDAVMADRGFTDWPGLRESGKELIIPALSLARGQGEGVARAPFSEEENERTYRIAHVRIHVERMMRAIKAGWRVFDRPIPMHRIPAVSRYIFSIAARMTTWEAPLQGVEYLDR